MEEEKRIKFSAEGNGLFNFIKQAKASLEGLQREGKNLADMLAAQAKAEGLAGKEAFRFTQDVLKGMKEQLKIQKELTKEKLEQNKLWQDELVGNNNKWAQEERRKAEIEGRRLNDQMTLLDERGKSISQAGTISSRNQQDSTPSRQSFFNDLVRADFFREMTQIVRSVPNAKTGLDLISPVMQLGGGLIGSGVGSLASIVTKIPGFSGVAGKLGKEAMGFIGDSLVRSRLAEDEFLKSQNSYYALTGRGDLTSPSSFVNKYGDKRIGMLDSGFEERYAKDIEIKYAEEEKRRNRFSNMGMTEAETYAAMTRVSMAAGTGMNSSNNVALMAGLQRGYGINENITTSALGTQRSGGGSGLSNVQRALGIAIGEGIDKTKFADAVKSQTAIFEMFSKNSTTQNVEDVNRVLFGINRLGGEFSIGDPRLMGNISAIQQGLSDPNNTFGQAQNYALLRRLHPDADPWHLREMQEEGLQTPEFLQEVLRDIGQGSGSDVFKKFQLKGRFPGLSMAAVDTLWSGFKDGKLPNDQEGLDKFLGLSKIESEASKYTTVLQKEQAEIQNAFKDNFVLGIEAIASSFEIEMKRAGVEIAQAWKELMKGGTSPREEQQMLQDFYNKRGESSKLSKTKGTVYSDSKVDPRVLEFIENLKTGN